MHIMYFWPLVLILHKAALNLHKLLWSLWNGLKMRFCLVRETYLLKYHNFFVPLSDVEASPGDLAPRAAAIEQGNGLANAFNVTAFVLRDLEAQIPGTIDQEVKRSESPSSSLGSVNGNFGLLIWGFPPNALMDERDRLISEDFSKSPYFGKLWSAL